MNNKFINNNGANLLHTKNIKKTKVESQIEVLKQQEQEISEQLEAYQIKQKKVKNLMNALWISEKFGNQFLNELVEAEKSLQKPDTWWLEKLIRNEVAFDFKFEASVESFYQLVFKKINGKVDSLNSELRNIKTQLQRQERIFARLEARRQNKVLLQCNYRKSIGCLGSYQCANCQSNYSPNNNQISQVAT